MGVIFLDEEKRVVSWNRWMVRHSGISSRAALGRSLVELFPDAALEHQLGQITGCLATGRPSFWSPMLHGAFLPLEVSMGGESISMMQGVQLKAYGDDAGGRLAAILIEDMTEQLLHEEELHETERRLRAERENLAVTLRSIGDGVVSTDANGCVRMLNPVAEELTGWSSEESSGRALGEVFNIVNEYTREPVKNPVQKVLESGMIVGLANHTVLIARDGRERPVADSAAPIRDSMGEVSGVVLVFRDFTAERDAQNQLEAACKAADGANQAKSTFLANASHEIRTPLNGVIGMARLLERTDLDETQADYVEMIHQSGSHLLRLINNLLDISKIEAHKQNIELVDTNLRACVRKAIGIVTPRAHEKALSIRGSVDARVPLIVRIDEGRICQVLVNLLGNAVKFTTVGGVLLQVTGQPLADSRWELQFAIHDSGPGIPADQRADLFDMFTQVGGSAPKDDQGTGLGLAISRRLVQFMDGTIELDSEVGKGSTFRFTIPAECPDHVQQRGPPEKIRPASTTPTSRPEIVVAEDNLINQKVALLALRALGFDADIVEDGEQLIEALEKKRYDLAFIDLRMPVCDGYQAAQRIRARWGEDQRPRLVALTASTTSAERQATLDAGMDGFVSKPFEEHELLREIKLASHRTPGTEVPARPLNEAERGAGCAGDFDQDRLANLTRLLDEDEIVSLIADHRMQVEQGLSTLQAGFRHCDLRTIAAEAHFLRSSVLTFGGVGFAEVLLRLEQQTGPLAPASFKELESLATSYIAHLAGAGCTPDRDVEGD